MNANWNNHHKLAAKQQLPVSATLAKALRLFETENKGPDFVVDLGCGAGIDTLALLKKGWKVMAIDLNKLCLEKLVQATPPDCKEQLVTANISFSEMILPLSLLVNASFSLPFCKPDDFSTVWKKITGSILPSGRFAGHFFGFGDSWSTNQNMTFHTREQVIEMFKGFEIEYFEETEKAGKTLGGEHKMWHVFHVVGCLR